MKILPLTSKTDSIGFATLVDFGGRIFLFDSNSDKESLQTLDLEIIQSIECIVIGRLPKVFDSGLEYVLSLAKSAKIISSNGVLGVGDPNEKAVVNNLLKGHLGKIDFTEGIKIYDKGIYALSKIWNDSLSSSATNLSFVVREHDELVVFMSFELETFDGVFLKTVEIFPNNSVELLVTRIDSSLGKTDVLANLKRMCDAKGTKIIDVSKESPGENENSSDGVNFDNRWIEV
ncbi:MAG TPA: hypothetical protein PKV16_05100 [Caldisericia bacterium]|nr:hypothetical protein [Caldisericia bacterium]HPF48690.1 hypothetical protein [Caldisericia bacterium]HPI83650.1 hypothetical protein [Caldisericia bacterium]HPQ93145.1 hypothetical protein [Caldisericia bacterium]HRV75022.1 hypothetical protein [Caldisericia bacterium]